ncbi:MAG TPA: IS1595 family transposase [Terriglobales bacterium]|jgi:transposase|nr:IS1595 family transposase [Terriglobales bacterium]
MNRRQTIPKELRYTIEQFHRRFPDDNACLEQIKEQRFPGGITFCEKCDAPRKHYRVKGRTAYACTQCGSHVFPLAGTIFEKTSTSLRLWFYAMYLMGSTRCGISAKQIQRETGVTYKTAWRMFHQIRKLMAETVKLSGPVEMDEMYQGGRRKSESGRKLRGDLNKLSSVFGIVERKGRIMARATSDVTRTTATAFVKECVLPESMIFTDEAAIYTQLPQVEGMGYQHRRINHTAKVYVSGDVHTNTIEGFWSLVKRGIGGVYHSVSQKYLQSYLDEYSFRYNRRDSGNLIFCAMLERAGEMVSRKPVLQE